MRKSIVVIVGLALLFFWQTVFFGRIPFPGNYQLAWFEPWKSDHTVGTSITIAHKPVMDDVFKFLYPFRVLAADLIKQSALPLWNPYNGSGAPLLATFHEALLNPFGVLFLFLSPVVAWTAFISLQLFVLGFATYWYARSIKLSSYASWFSSLVLMSSGYVVVRFEYGQFLYGYATLPLFLTIIESWRNNQHIRLMLLIPLVTLFLCLSGQPHMILFVLLTSSVYCCFRLRFWQVLRFAGLVTLGIGLASIQFFPSFELFTRSTIKLSHASTFVISRFLMPIGHLITILIPNYFGSIATYNYSGAGGDSIETMASIGLIPCFLAFLALRNKHWVGRFFGSIVLITVALAVDWPGSRMFYQLPIPVLTTEAPSRFFALTTFAIAMLSGIGLDQWIKQGMKPAKNYLFVYVGLILVIAGVTFYSFMQKLPCPLVQVPECRLVSVRNTFLELTPFILVVALLFVRKKSTVIVIAGIVLVLGLYNGYKFLPFSAPDAVMPTNEVIQALQTHTRDARFIGLGNAAMVADLSTAYRLYDANYYNPLYISRYGELIEYANSGNTDQLARSDVIINSTLDMTGEGLNRRNRLMQLLSIRYVLYKKSELASLPKDVVWENDKWTVTTNNEALPRVYTVNSAKTITDDSLLLQTLFDPSFDPKTEVLIEDALPIRLTDNAQASAHIRSFKEQELTIDVSSSANTMLVVTDTFYPGWNAMIDGKETPIYRANYTLRSVIVPEGNHTIVMRYQPFSVRLGILTSLGFLLFYLIYVRFIWTKQSKTVSK